MKPKNTICLWFDKDAHEAARVYAVTFLDSIVTGVHEAPRDYPSGWESDSREYWFDCAKRRWRLHRP